MLKIQTSRTANKYNGNVTVTDADVAKVEVSFKSKFEAFTYAIEQGWTKKCVMKYALGTDRDQYFYNYYNKYLATKK